MTEADRRKQVPLKEVSPIGSIADVIHSHPLFERYLKGGDRLTVLSSKNLMPDLISDQIPQGKKQEAEGLSSQLATLHHITLENQGTTRRNVVLMEDTSGNTSLIIVCRDATPPPGGKDEAYGNLSFIGGCGIYEQTDFRDGLAHTKLLSVIMRRKCRMAALDLGGMKATIPKESDWLNSPVLQQATGFLFSKAGPFQDAITGTDAGQTPQTIANMASGSEIGGDHQIAGHYYPDLDTPGSCRFSLEATYDTLREHFPDKVPALKGQTVLVEGFGRIGRTAVRLMLERGAQVIVSDPLLTGEEDILPQALVSNEFRYKDARDFILRKFMELKTRYKERIKFVNTRELHHKQALVFCPCADSEGSVSEKRIKELAKQGVRVILSGANNPFGARNVWKSARTAHDLGMIVPPEILSNCGSVTAAAAEPLLRKAREKDPNMTPKRFVEERVVPYITENTKKKIISLIKIMKELDIDLYTAGEILFRQEARLSYKIGPDGILVA